MKSEKNTNQTKESKKNLVNFFNGSFFGLPRNIIEKRKKMKAASFVIQDYFFAYFSSESGQRIGYKHFFIQQLSKELDMDRKTFREGLREIEEAGILKFYDFEHKGKIAFFENDLNKDLIEKLEANELFINIDMKLNISISSKKIDEKIINFPSNEVGKITPSCGENRTTKWGDSTHQVGKITPSCGENHPTLATSKMIDWSTFEADLEKVQEAYIKEDLYKESYHKEVSSLAAKVDTQAIKNEMMNDDIYNKIEKKEEDKISNFYLSEMIDLGIYDYKAKEYISKISTDDIQKAFDKLEAAKDSGRYIKNEGNFIRETLESFINPNFKPKYSIQEKEAEVLPIPTPIRKDNPNELEIRLNEYLEFFIPNITKVIHGFDTKVDEFNKKLITKFNAYILETYSEDQELNNNRDRFIAQIQELKKDSNNKVKDIVYLSVNDCGLNKKTGSGKRVLDLFLAWFEEV